MYNVYIYIHINDIYIHGWIYVYTNIYNIQSYVYITYRTSTGIDHLSLRSLMGMSMYILLHRHIEAEAYPGSDSAGEKYESHLELLEIPVGSSSWQNQ